MINSLFKHFSRGTTLIKNNPQILYTLFLIISISFAFLYSGQNFFEASNENQNRMENESFGLMQDSFVLIATDKLNDAEALNQSVRFFKEKNPSISEFIVVRLGNGTSTILASLNPDDIGKEDVVNKRLVTEQEGIMKSQTLLAPAYVNGERHWKAFRGITDPSGRMMVAYFMTDFSMKWLDDLSSKSFENSYLVLMFIIGGIFLLLVRQVRMIDYTVLYHQLKEVNQMKDDFISMAAHELRTPLTVIRGYVDLLREIPNLDEKHKGNLQNIDVSAKQLNLLVGDILDVTRIEQGRMNLNFVPLDVGNSIKDLAASFEQPVKEKGLTLSLDIAPGLPMISADSEKMRQIMTNFIGNAVKYTIRGGITVKVGFDEIKKEVFVRISDTGVGISAEDQKRLFQKFSRIRNKETENISGTGLGLWITNQMVFAMKGNISVESIKGKGTDFIASFPAIPGKS
jgi:signal transduction histidine kinase